ncbi:MAG: hypothetical protein ACRDA5_11085 [Clostridium sp.]
MRVIEKIYNKYFNNTVDKVTLAVISVYGILVMLLSFLMIIEDESIVKSIVKTISGNVGFYMPWVIIIMPVVRFSQIINEKNVLEGITAKSYKEKFIEMIKIYAVMYLVYVFVAIIHKILLPIVNNDFKTTEDMKFVFGNYLYTMCFSIGMAMYCISGSIVRNLGGVKLTLGILITGIAFYMNSAMFNLINILTRGKGVKLYLGTNSISNTISYFGVIIVYIIFIFVFMKFILKNINKIDPKKTWWI